MRDLDSNMNMNANPVEVHLIPFAHPVVTTEPGGKVLKIQILR